MSLRFDLLGQDGIARCGRLTTAHSVIDTPVFMPVGTAATVKALTVEMVEATGAKIILGNTYHLMLRPGAERVARLGGLHRFMNWPYSILTDSGGFQVMSLAELRQMDEAGVTFTSHIDGARHHLTPERSIEIQHLLGANITMQLDECTPYPVEAPLAGESMRLSARWAERSKRAFVERPGHGLFGIVQGSVIPELRRESAERLQQIGFDGYAVGGLAVGEGQELMFATLEATCPHLPDDRPRYLMGVGKPDDIVGAIARGIDLFDCVMPTRSGRTGQAFTRFGPINLRNARFKDDPEPLDPQANCPASCDYSKAYLHHLVKAKEMLGAILLSWHNVHFYLDLTRRLREAIAAGRFEQVAKQFLSDYRQNSDNHGESRID